jgi:hypothetical protein
LKIEFKDNKSSRWFTYCYVISMRQLPESPKFSNPQIPKFSNSLNVTPSCSNYLKSIESWQGLETYLQLHPLFASSMQYGKLSLQQMGNYMHLRQFENAERCAAKCNHYFKKSSNNWHIYMIFYFLLDMQREKYENASKIFDIATADARFRDIPYSNQEKWQIFEAYIYFVEGAAYKQSNKVQKKLDRRKFRFSSFLNDLHVYNKDMAGFNVAILIIEICILIQSGEDQNIVLRMDALKRYKSRNLGKTTDRNYRVKVFMELLFEFEKARYQVKALKNKARLLLKKLEARPIEYSDNIEGIEVINFEKLWEMVIENS